MHIHKTYNFLSSLQAEFLEIRGSQRTARLQTNNDLIEYDALLLIVLHNKIISTIKIYNSKMQHRHQCSSNPKTSYITVKH